MSVTVSICNSALIKLGASPIQNLLEDSKEARLCNLQFEKIRNSVLRSSPWSFAMRRAELTPVTGATLEFGSQNVFQLPSDCLRVVKMYENVAKKGAATGVIRGEGEDRPDPSHPDLTTYEGGCSSYGHGEKQIRYSIEGRNLLTNVSTAQIFYITDDISDEEYDYNFREALANMLAADLCYSITQSNARFQELQSAGEYWIGQARSTNSQEVTPEDFQFDDFLTARRWGCVLLLAKLLLSQGVYRLNFLTASIQHSIVTVPVSCLGLELCQKAGLLKCAALVI
jgi:hypothetical protein